MDDEDEDCIPCHFTHGVYYYGIFTLSTLPVHFAVVLIGVQYSDPEYCRIDIVPQFLQVGGGVMLVLNILYLLSTCCFSENDRMNLLGFRCRVVLVCR